MQWLMAWSCLALFLLIVRGGVRADEFKPGDSVVVRLNDGTQHEGQLKSQNQDEIMLETGPGMSEAFSRSDIKTVTRPGFSPASTTSNQQPASPTPNHPAGDGTSAKAIQNPSSDEASQLNAGAAALFQQGRYTEAIPILKKLIQLMEKSYGLEHPNTANRISDLGQLYKLMGDYSNAEPLYLRALQIREKALGPEHPDVANSLNNLGMLYFAKGDYSKAEKFDQGGLKINEKALGPEHPSTAMSLNNLAGLYFAKGDYAMGEQLNQRALRIREKVLGPEHPDTAMSLNNLAELYFRLGDHAKAASFFERIVSIQEKARGPEHPYLGMSLCNLAHAYASMGEHAKARTLVERAVYIYDKVLGPEHPQTASGLSFLGKIYCITGNLAKTEPLLQRAFQVREKILGPEHPDTAQSLKDLALMCRIKGDYAKVEQFDQRILEIHEKVFGPDSPHTTESLDSLARDRLDLGKPVEARELAVRKQRAELKALANILSFTSEQQRLAYQSTTNPYSLFATMDCASDLASAILHNKGVVLDSLLEDRLVSEASTDPKQRELLAELRAAKQRMMQVAMEVPSQVNEETVKRREVGRDTLGKEVQQLEAAVARQVSGMGMSRRAVSVTTEQVQATIPKQTVLVEFLRYRHYLGKDKWEVRYGALILAPEGEPRWTVLGSAAALERVVKAYQACARGRVEEGASAAVLRELAKQVWDPVEKALPARTHTVIISPDAELNFVSFATLLTKDGEFLCQQYSLRYVASGRDLLREVAPRPSKLTLHGYANPQFDWKTSGSNVQEAEVRVTSRIIELKDFCDLFQLSPLPGTEMEAKGLIANSKAFGFQETTMKLGADATETDLNNVRSPPILHLATHGFFLPEIQLETDDTVAASMLEDRGNRVGGHRGKILKNPMYRSGLALAGAQTTLRSWGRGEAPPAQSDGIVTAEEVGGLKLSGTWLTVLSACSTGTGEAKAGEGVLGLRRGFVQAGTQNLLMTLWPVADQETAQFMIEFYAVLHREGNAPKALDTVQRDWLIRLRKEKGLVYAVNRAGPFIMSSTGKP